MGVGKIHELSGGKSTKIYLLEGIIGYCFHKESQSLVLGNLKLLSWATGISSNQHINDQNSVA